MLCVGLDPDLERLPAHLASEPDALYRFCAGVVDATADLACAFKPQIAYFSAVGAEAQLERLIDYIQRTYASVPVILDAKRGDIGATARLYAMEAFDRYGADAVTVNAYLGPESLTPYLAYPGRGVIVLCRTSNDDSGWLQNHPADDPVFLRIAAAARSWQNENVLLVAGATYADDLRRIREAAGDTALLVPGIGARGGDLAAVISAGLASDGWGLVINASRSILYAGSGLEYAEAARAAAREMRDEIRTLRSRR
jgi:orotidine-5'-phosphate decarboxylase